ncbi:MAG: DinB family protein [Chloroflexota bacterium]|jgi:uncharacterized damage-inducible protein DinB
MNAADICYLFGYDRWATGRVLAATIGVDDAVWGATGTVGDRGLGSILVHMLGSHQRWRHELSGLEGEPRPERDRLPTIAAVAEAWIAEWSAFDDWLATVDDEAVTQAHDGIPVWRLLAHLGNHGTQHRSEAAVLLTAAGHSPGDLDMVDYAEEIGTGSPLLDPSNS